MGTGVAFHCAFRDRVRDREVLRFGTATTQPSVARAPRYRA